jgi:hypothetical protein
MCFNVFYAERFSICNSSRPIEMIASCKQFRASRDRKSKALFPSALNGEGHSRPHLSEKPIKQRLPASRAEPLAKRG